MQHPALERPLKVTISFTERCNLDCQLCYADCGNSEGRNELTLSDWRRFLDELESLGVMQLYFEGGEPLVREDFVELLRHCGHRFFTLVRTNATLIDESVANELAKANVARVYVDLLGSNAVVHDGLTGVQGSFEQSLSGLEHLRRAGIVTHFLTILNRRNAHDLQGYLDLAGRLQVTRVGILRLYPLGRAKHNWDSYSMTLDEQNRILTNLRTPKGVQLMLSWHPLNRNCCWDSAAINAFGDSIGCAYLREYVNYGNIREIDFLTTYEHPTYRLLRSGEVDSHCQGCSHTQGTKGGCRAAAYAYHGSWTAPDPYCARPHEGVDLSDLPKRLF